MGSRSNIRVDKVVSALRELGSASMGELRDATGLSVPTVHRALKDLREAGAVEPPPVAPGKHSRHPLRYQLVQSAPVAGLVVGNDRIDACISKRLNVVESRLTLPAPESKPGELMRRCIDQLQELLEAVDVAPQELGALTIGLPLAVNRRHGARPTRVLADWRSLDVRSIFGRLLQASGFCEELTQRLEVGQVANLGALGARLDPRLGSSSHLVYFYVGDCLLTGSLVGGRLYREASGLIGHMTPLASKYPQAVCPTCGRECVEEQALQYMREATGLSSMEQVVGMALEHDVEATCALMELARMLAHPAAVVCLTLDPEYVVLGGEMGREVACATELHVRMAELLPDRLNQSADVVSDIGVEVGQTRLPMPLAGALEVARQRLYTAEPIL
jgi:predicted NBD/HSP70 family sugar kinase